MQDALFYGFSGIALVSASGVLLNVRNSVNAAMSLVVTMLSLAVLFILLSAEFIGVIQVMVYAGAIVVLFLFVVMLLNLRGGKMGAERRPIMKLAGALIAAAAAAKLVLLLQLPPASWPATSDGFGGVRDIGLVLFTDYMLAVQVSGILLLAGIVGAVVLAKRSVD